MHTLAAGVCRYSLKSGAKVTIECHDTPSAYKVGREVMVLQVQGSGAGKYVPYTAARTVRVPQSRVDSCLL